MRAVVFRGPGDIAVEEVDQPEIEEPGDAIVRVTLAGIGGADVQAYAGRLRRHPSTIGHEAIGVIEAVGPGVTKLKAGQRVASPAWVSCGGCFYCKQGLLGSCGHSKRFGRDIPGAQAQYIRVPHADAVLELLPDALSDEQGVLLADLLPGVFAALTAAPLRAGDCVAVVGCGPTGLAAQLLARVMGAGNVIGVDPHDYRRRVAVSVGASSAVNDPTDALDAVRAVTEGRGADVSIEAGATPEGVALAIDLVRTAGTVLSLSGGIEEMGDVPVDRLLAKQARIEGISRPATRNQMAPLVKMIARGVFDPTPLISHTLPLADAPRAYELMAQRSDGALKVLLRP